MRLIIDLGDRKVEELHPSEAMARSHLSVVIHSHKSRGHQVARRLPRAPALSHFVVHTPEGALQYWLER